MTSRTRRRGSLPAALVLAVTGGLPAAAAPDLRLEWMSAGRPSAAAEPVTGAAGERRRLEYRLRNVGDQDAFAAVVAAYSSLGPVGEPLRLEPGPRAGGDLRRHVDLPLAQGMRQLCLEARLQNLGAEDPGDPNPSDNRICRPVRVTAPAAEAASTPTISDGGPEGSVPAGPRHQPDEEETTR